MYLPKKSIKQRVYDLCLEGLPACKIHRILRRDKSRISRIINSLVEDGFLLCSNPKDKILFYEATNTKFPPGANVILSTIQQEKIKKVNNPGLFLRCHGNNYQADVYRMGKVPWVRVWKSKAGIHYEYKRGETTFIFIRGKFSSVINVHLPSIDWDIRKGDPEQYLRERAGEAILWFSRYFNCDFRGLRHCGKSEWAVPIKNKVLVSIAKEHTVRWGDVMALDESLGYPELESISTIDKMTELLELPERVERLEKETEKMVSMVETLCKIFDVPKSKDEFMDVT